MASVKLVSQDVSAQYTAQDGQPPSSAKLKCKFDEITEIDGLVARGGVGVRGLHLNNDSSPIRGVWSNIREELDWGRVEVGFGLWGSRWLCVLLVLRNDCDHCLTLKLGGVLGGDVHAGVVIICIAHPLVASGEHGDVDSRDFSPCCIKVEPCPWQCSEYNNSWIPCSSCNSDVINKEDVLDFGEFVFVKHKSGC